jgi:formyl-CoA transferase
MSKRDTASWVEILNAAGVPCGPIYDIGQMFSDPQVQHLGVAGRVADADLTLMAQPVTLSRTPSRLDRRPPERGGDSEEVLAEFGFSRDEIGSLRAAGTI